MSVDLYIAFLILIFNKGNAFAIFEEHMDDISCPDSYFLYDVIFKLICFLKSFDEWKLVVISFLRFKCWTWSLHLFFWIWISCLRCWLSFLNHFLFLLYLSFEKLWRDLHELINSVNLNSIYIFFIL
jgi:hypothetical protein